MDSILGPLTVGNSHIPSNKDHKVLVEVHWVLVVHTRHQKRLGTGGKHCHKVLPTAQVYFLDVLGMRVERRSSTCLSVCLSACLSIGLTVSPSLCLSHCVYTCLSVCLSVSVSSYLPARLALPLSSVSAPPSITEICAMTHLYSRSQKVGT